MFWLILRQITCKRLATSPAILQTWHIKCNPKTILLTSLIHSPDNQLPEGVSILHHLWYVSLLEPLVHFFQRGKSYWMYPHSHLVCNLFSRRVDLKLLYTFFSFGSCQLSTCRDNKSGNGRNFFRTSRYTTLLTEFCHEEGKHFLFLCSKAIPLEDKGSNRFSV